MTTRLDTLLDGIADAPSLAVAGLALDSRRIRQGEAFVAIRGRAAHGLDFLDTALGRGARAVLWDPADAARPTLPEGVAAVPVPALTARLGTIADRACGSPSARLSVAGVTGTNGKTTCAWLLAEAGSRLGRSAAYLGTLGAGFPPAVGATGLTTPDVLTLHRLLAELQAAGAERVVLEASSHALDQDRLAGVRVEIAAFTNLTRDHLDYHGSMEAYAAAKWRLFSRDGIAHAVINVGDATGRRFAASLPANVALTAVSVGAAPHAVDALRHLQVTSVRTSGSGLDLVVRGDFGERTLQSPLVGAFNAENLAVVLGVLLAWGHDVDASIEALAAASPPPGRMEGFRTAREALAIVDYAHTPDALAKVLEAAREHATGRLVVVFGCGGDRDPGKRAPMGGIAERLADRVIVTDDNPRSEDPARIVQKVLEGMRRPKEVRVVHDRRAAIEAALAEAGAGDVVVIAGKGHEREQLVGGEARPFSDRECVARLAGGAS
jgi:UDP-N-acetylmuramoyl-L-alanyl-D-glutamate--2,6-diaminopimelate ligase